MEQEVSKKIRKIPYIIIAIGMAAAATGAAYFFVYIGKFLYEVPKDLELPWIFIFLGVFLVLLVRNRIKVMRADQKPVLK
jgi:hypothetical protein